MKSTNDIQKELQDLNIHLPKINEASFDIPQNYFENVEQQINTCGTI